MRPGEEGTHAWDSRKGNRTLLERLGPLEVAGAALGRRNSDTQRLTKEP